MRVLSIYICRKLSKAILDVYILYSIMIMHSYHLSISLYPSLSPSLNLFTINSEFFLLSLLLVEILFVLYY